MQIDRIRRPYPKHLPAQHPANAMLKPTLKGTPNRLSHLRPSRSPSVDRRICNRRTHFTLRQLNNNIIIIIQSHILPTPWGDGGRWWQWWWWQWWWWWWWMNQATMPRSHRTGAHNTEPPKSRTHWPVPTSVQERTTEPFPSHPGP